MSDGHCLRTIRKVRTALHPRCESAPKWDPGKLLTIQISEEFMSDLGWVPFGGWFTPPLAIRPFPLR
jgi:hypothetical protein